MKKLLPVLLFLLLFIFLLFPVDQAFGQLTPSPVPGVWHEDSEVTFIGKTGARSGKFLDWALRSYPWAHEIKDLREFWTKIVTIVYSFSVLFVLVTAFVMIITRGRSITIMRFIPRFILIILLITFSFSLVRFTYQIGDAIQGFFLQNPDGQIIQQQDLLYIGFDYETFNGYRLVGPENDESAFISLLLVKLTAITYYTMTGILLLRKVILWFFIIISPVFPLLLLYRPIRNTGKIWIGEFFRWLLYAPLFAIFLSGLVKLWRAGGSEIPGIPLDFSGINEAGTKIVYPTAINILLGGPGQRLSITNSVNITETFALYVVALLMLWVVILLPFLLLQIFLDYLHSLSFGEISFVKQFMNASHPFLSKYGFVSTPPPIPPSVIPPVSPPGAGIARALPFGNKAAMTMNEENQSKTSQMSMNQMSSSQTSSSQVSSAQSSMSQVAGLQRAESFTSHLLSSRMLTPQLAQANKDILGLTNLSVPTMRDIARFEMASMSSNIKKHQDIATVHESLEKIANPRRVSTSEEREKYIQLREKLIEAKQKGNPMAVSILSAAGHLSQKETGVKLPSSIFFPASNRVQSVNHEDYEGVKSMWKENYQKMEPPKLKGIEKSRKEWLKEEIEIITQTINYLQSHNQEKVKEGMDMVGKVLPFLLIGGFSHEEVVAYLKAKLEAAKGVLEEVEQQETEEETMVERKATRHTADTITMAEKAEIPETEKDTENPQMTPELKTDKKEGALNLADISLPTMSDVAKYEIAASSFDTKKHQEVSKVNETLQKIANPESSISETEKEHYKKVKEELVEAKQKGDPTAISVLSAAENILKKESDKSTGESSMTSFPSSNLVQNVSLDDYENVKEMWKENYQKLEPPKDMAGTEKNKDEYLQDEIKIVNEAIECLVSNNPELVNKGVNMVAKILPVFLIGGFSHDEVVAYLKAKLEAAKSVLSELRKEKDSEQIVNVNNEKTEEKKMEMQEELSDQEKSKLKDPIAELEKKLKDKDV